MSDNELIETLRGEVYHLRAMIAYEVSMLRIYADTFRADLPTVVEHMDEVAGHLDELLDRGIP